METENNVCLLACKLLPILLLILSQQQPHTTADVGDEGVKKSFYERAVMPSNME